MKKTLLNGVAIALALFVAASCWAKPISVVSPDGKNRLEIDQVDGNLTYAIFRNDKSVIVPTPISITIDGVEYPSKAPIGPVRVTKGDPATVKPVVPTIASEINSQHNELLVTFQGVDVALRAWAFDGGVAFRWESAIDKEVKVNAEKLAFNFANDFPVYFPKPNGKDFFSHQENLFAKKPISQTAGMAVACPPVLFELGDGQYMLFSDVNVERYPGTWVQGTDSTTITATFPHYPLEVKLHRDRDFKVEKYADFLAKTNGRRSYPWRAFVLADAKGLAASTLTYNLSEPSRLENTSWIKPGKVAWDWWNDFNIYDVPFKSGVNQDTYKNYIDFASKHGLPYVILDEGWSVPGPENLLNVVKEIDMPALSAYAQKKNVGLILWMTSTALEANFDKAFEQFAEWNVKGLKVDFMQRDDQVMMDFLYRVAKKAAAHKMMVDFHGGSKPAGITRTWPNVVTIEAVQGLEQNKWCENANPDMAVLLPFTRQVVGPMDYTPGAMINLTEEEFEARRKAVPQAAYHLPASQGTRCQQLAMYVVYRSPLQMLADTPSNYRKNPKAMEFLDRVPVTWDETRVLKAEVGDCIILARRHGKDWYIGAMTDWNARDVKVKFDFLPKGDYKLESWTDAETKFCQKNCIPFTGDVGSTISKVTSGSEITISMAKGGGYVGIISAE